MIEYHDREWGVPVHDDRLLFEMLTLEGAQAGLSWKTVLHKRQRYREVFCGFDPEKVACMRKSRIDRLMLDPGIIRNRLKLHSVGVNARVFLEVQAASGSFHGFLWGLFGHQRIVNRPGSMRDVQARSEQGDRLSRELLRRGFRFVGPTICHAFLQAVGVIDDHLLSCPCKNQIHESH